MMGATMLTFEWDKESEQLEIHADAQGLSDLAVQLKKISDGEGEEHLHLMTEGWGGDELSNNKQNSNAELINHVKIFKWKSE